MSNSNPTAQKLYRLFWDNKNIRQYLLLHKEQLLKKVNLKITDNHSVNDYQPYIVISNTLYSDGSVSMLPSRIENNNIDLAHNFQLSITKYIDEKKIEEFVITRYSKLIQDLEKKPLPLIMKAISSLSNEKKLINLLHTYNLIPANIQTLKDIDNMAQNFLQKFVSKEFINDLVGIIGNIDELYINVVYQDLLNTNNFYINLFDKDKKEMFNVFDALYDSKIIESGKLRTFFECIHCNNGDFHGTAMMKIRPSQLFNLKCPVHDKEVHFLAPYYFNEVVYQDIIHKDGILFHAVNYLLKNKNIQVINNQVFSPDTEIDIIYTAANKAGVIELKMLKTNTSKETQIKNLQAAVSQLLSHKFKLIQQDAKFQSYDFILLSNITDDNIIQSVKESKKDELSKYNLKILTVENFPDFI